MLFSFSLLWCCLRHLPSKIYNCGNIYHSWYLYLTDFSIVALTPKPWNHYHLAFSGSYTKLVPMYCCMANFKACKCQGTVLDLLENLPMNFWIFCNFLRSAKSLWLYFLLINTLKCMDNVWCTLNDLLIQLPFMFPVVHVIVVIQLWLLKGFRDYTI